MGDHFVLFVDRLITEATLQAAIDSRNRGKFESILLEPELTIRKNDRDYNVDGKLVECRICQEEEWDSNLEIPCSCCGSLKYAHRRCVQRWCNEKGDTMCEICLQQFKPDYTAPPKLFQYGRIPMNFRGTWEISSRDIQNHRFITMVQNTGSSSHYDDYGSASTRSIMYCRIVAVLLMVLLILHHFLPIITSGAEQYSLPLLSLVLLRTAGIVLPLYVMMRTVTTFHYRRLQQGPDEFSVDAAEDENTEPQSLQPVQTV